jgi:hypothetical protein
MRFCVVIIFTIQNSTSSRLLHGSSYSCCIRNLHALVHQSCHPVKITTTHEILQRRKWQLCKSTIPPNHSRQWARQVRRWLKTIVRSRRLRFWVGSTTGVQHNARERKGSPATVKRISELGLFHLPFRGAVPSCAPPWGGCAPHAPSARSPPCPLTLAVHL